MISFYVVMITEASDDRTMESFLLGAGRQGNISTITLNAFTKDEIEIILTRFD